MHKGRDHSPIKLLQHKGRDHSPIKLLQLRFDGGKDRGVALRQRDPLGAQLRRQLPLQRLRLRSRRRF
jgi:hypothetical protein